MAGTSISRAKYERMIAVARLALQSPTASAREADTDYNTWCKYWRRGGNAPWARPIKDVIAEEQTAARARLARENEHREIVTDEQIARDVEDARDDKAATRIEEAKLSRVARKNAIELLELTSEVIGCAKELRDTLRKKMKTAASKLSAAEIVRLLREAGAVVAQGNEAAKTVVQLERLILGEPTDSLALHFESREEAEAAIVRSHALLQKAKRLEGEPDDDTPTVH